MKSAFIFACETKKKVYDEKKSIVLVFVALMLGVLYAPLKCKVKFGVKGGVNIASVHF